MILNFSVCIIPAAALMKNAADRDAAKDGRANEESGAEVDDKRAPANSSVLKFILDQV